MKKESNCNCPSGKCKCNSEESSESPMREKFEKGFRKEAEYAVPQRPVAGYKKAAKSQFPKK